MISDGKVNDANLMERITDLIAGLSDEKKQMLLETLIEWQQKDQRSDHRITCLIAVDYATQKRAYQDFMQDLSKGGVFIETREPLNIGEALSLTFSVPKSDSHFKIAGKIVRSDEKGVGVEFDTKLSQHEEEVIKGAMR
jgi:Tfp pilus assembly protein PilZ